MSFFQRTLVVFWAFGVVVPVLRTANGYAIDILGHSATTLLTTLAEIPTSCNDTCNAIIDDINVCSTFQCLCNSANTAGITECADCLEAVKPNQTVIGEAQGIIDQYASICNAGGISVPTQTASGFTGIVGSATTATGSGFPTPSFASSFSGSLSFLPSVSATPTSPGVSSSSASASSLAAASTPAAASTSPTPTTAANGASGSVKVVFGSSARVMVMVPVVVLMFSGI